jgi:hypothetical protein
MKSINKLLFLFAVVLLVSGCTKKPDIENTSTYKMSNEFFVQTFEAGGTTPVLGFEKIITYNTSDPNSGQVWMDDLGHIWPMKGKLDVDYGSLTFKAKTGIPNGRLTGKTMDVIEGKVIPNGGHSKTGVVVDSIFLKMSFSDDPGNVYEFRGHGRTGFFEDEY